MIGAGRDRRVVGQLVPPRPARVEVRGTASAVEVTADDLGRFAADAPGRGPVSLRCHLPDITVVTEWIPG